MAQADYRLVEETDEINFIVDLNLGQKSVTNDAEEVVRELNARFPGRRIVYRDSEGGWGELKHDNGRFTGFARWDGDTPPWPHHPQPSSGPGF